MEIARDSLQIKRKVLERYADGNLYPYSRNYLRDIKKRFGTYWRNHFSTIGIVGMNEACVNLLGKDIGTDEGCAFAEEVLEHMRQRLAVFQEQTGALFNLEATPAEGTSYRLARLDKQNYPSIIDAGGDSDGEPFYTNSSLLPTDYAGDVLSMLDQQDSLQCKYTGGTVMHVFLGEAAPDPMAVKEFVKMTCSNYKLPYFTLTPSFSVCSTHGYINGEHATCPKCGGEAEVYSRVVGYLRPVSQWNAGKQAEFKMRTRYSLGHRHAAPVS